MLAACEGNGIGKPESVGEPFEITVIADNNDLAETAKGFFSCNEPAMPQAECLYTTRVMESVNDVTRFMRNLVVVRKKPGKTRLRYERNPYANNQLMAVIDVESKRQLTHDSARLADAVKGLIIGTEATRAVGGDSQNHNLKFSKEVKETTGHDMTIPAYMTTSKRGKDFIWMSDNGNKLMRNICVYAINGTIHSRQNLIDKRDSVMAANIKGEREGMEMATERRADILFEEKQGLVVVRGLWMMKGDAMGGPFVSVTTIDTVRGRTVTAEAFIYGPSAAKAKAMKHLEAFLLTLK